MATKKKLIKEIRRRAAEVPAVELFRTEKHYVKGAELIAQGTEEVEGQPINPDKIYLQHMPVVIHANHSRRMRKVFKKHGNEGLLAYYDAVDRANGSTPPPRDVARAAITS